MQALPLGQGCVPHLQQRLYYRRGALAVRREFPGAGRKGAPTDRADRQPQAAEQAADAIVDVPQLPTPTGADQLGVEGLFETVDQRVRFERLSKQANRAIVRRTGIDAHVRTCGDHHDGQPAATYCEQPGQI